MPAGAGGVAVLGWFMTFLEFRGRPARRRSTHGIVYSDDATTLDVTTDPV